jgi:hypothetical protein
MWVLSLSLSQFLSLSPVQNEVSHLAPLHAPHHDIYLIMAPVVTQSSDHGLRSVKPWAKRNLSSLKWSQVFCHSNRKLTNTIIILEWGPWSPAICVKYSFPLSFKYSHEFQHGRLPNLKLYFLLILIPSLIFLLITYYYQTYSIFYLLFLSIVLLPFISFLLLV